MSGEIIRQQPDNITFTLTEEEALQAALRYMNAEVYMWQDSNAEALLKQFQNNAGATYYPVGEKVIAPDSTSFIGTKLKTAYKFNIYAKQPHNRKMVYVDAQTGEILYASPLILFDNEIGTAHTQYSGIQPINTTSQGGQYILQDNTRGDGIKTLNCNRIESYSNVTEFYDNDNVWNNVNANLDQYATDAHFATMKTYDYYLTQHGRNSLDDMGYPLWSYMHFGYNYGNAFWNGQFMTYGDGDGGTTPFVALDIAGHEITHGLTSMTADLYYEGESGALNEAFSDIFGVSIEHYARPNNTNWTMGEDIGYVIRSMSDPNAYGYPKTYHGLYWFTGSDDNGGVHYNSSVLSYWFYLLCTGGSGVNDFGNQYNVTAISREHAEAIAFRTLTLYLYSYSDYTDTYYAAIEAATDLYGSCSPEVQSVGNAFYAIGVAQAPYAGVITADFAMSEQAACAPPLTVYFSNRSTYSGSCIWDFGDGSPTSTDNSPVHTYQNYGQYTVTLIADGGTCGRDTIIKRNVVVVDAALPCATVMPNNSTLTLNSCSGFIYDAGGPNNNYPDYSHGIINIHNDNATSIVLDIQEFNIEPGSYYDCTYDFIAFYDGNSIWSPQIGTSYCNSTGNPGQISSTGSDITIEFYSDEYLNFSGFKIAYHCTGNNIAPSSYFEAVNTTTCTGLVQFLDKSYNEATSWLWDFGDGTTATEQNPVHQYLDNGVYSVRLTATNAYGSNALLISNYITVQMPELNVEDVMLCDEDVYNISLEMPNSVKWYLPGNETPVHTGNTWSHPAVSNTTTYYVRDVFQGGAFYVGPTNNTTGGNFFGNTSAIHYLVFDAYSPFTLKSVSVNAQGSGMRSIALRNATGTIIDQRDINIPNGVSRVQLDIDVPQGANFQLVGLDAPYLYRTSDGSLNYPYTIPDVLSIKQSSATGNVTDYYYYFYDWEVETPDCKSEIVQVILMPVCTGIAESSINQTISAYPNPSSGLFTLKGLNDNEHPQVILTNIVGQTVSAATLTGNTIDLTAFPSGIYFLKEATGAWVLKLVVGD
jgi:Zn-dependent metalloprotease